jgi:streptomycin 6-kinase
LHGDFIDKNLLFDGGGYVATDPIPRVGDPCSDIGFFAAYHPPARGLLDTAADIARAMGEDVDRAVQWASVLAVGEACETWRADSDDLQAVVRGLEL